jgi:hypothetical protein
MTARVYSASEVERKRYQRACRKAAYEGGEVDHFAHLQRQFEASRDLDDSARIFCAVETYFGRDFPQAAAATANLHISAWATAIACAVNILHQTERLLTHAQSLLAAENHLGSRSGACLRNDGAKLR